MNIGLQIQKNYCCQDRQVMLIGQENDAKKQANMAANTIKQCCKDRQTMLKGNEERAATTGN